MEDVCLGVEENVIVFNGVIVGFCIDMIFIVVFVEVIINYRKKLMFLIFGWIKRSLILRVV